MTTANISMCIAALTPDCKSSSESSKTEGAIEIANKKRWQVNASKQQTKYARGKRNQITPQRGSKMIGASDERHFV